MSNYRLIIDEAIVNLITDYEEGRISLLSEGDLECQLFFYCRKIMEREKMYPPVIFSQKWFGKKKVDLILGDEVLELKFEPRNGKEKRVFSTIKDSGGQKYDSIEGDLNKISEYATEDKIGRFIMIDEKSVHKKKISQNWKQLKNGSSFLDVTRP